MILDRAEDGRRRRGSILDAQRRMLWWWWQTLGGILNTQRGRAEDSGESILDTPCRVMWQSRGQWQAPGEASSTLNIE